MSATEQRVPISSVRIVDRHRRDLGDLDELAMSILEVGLIQPIVVNAGLRLIAGQRRLLACQLLGWGDIPAVVTTRLVDAADLLKAERDENTCRKSMAPSELIALGLELEELEKPKARQRMAEAGRSAAPGRPAQSPLPRTEPFKTDNVVAAALGLGASNYYRAKVLVKAAGGGDERAAAAVEQMDRTGKITPAYNTYKGRPAAPAGSRPAPAEGPPPARRTLQRSQRDALASAVSTLRGLALGLEDLQELDPEITCEEAARWERDLSRVLRVLRNVHSKVKEHAQW